MRFSYVDIYINFGNRVRGCSFYCVIFVVTNKLVEVYEKVT